MTHMYFNFSSELKYLVSRYCHWMMAGVFPLFVQLLYGHVRVMIKRMIRGRGELGHCPVFRYLSWHSGVDNVDSFNTREQCSRD